jgi:tetratricopeptide (TPR) repeat protein
MSRAKSFSKTRTRGPRKPSPKALPSGRSFLKGQNLNIVLSILLAALTIALYSPVMGHSFIVLDDQEYVTTNPHIHDGLSWNTIKWAFTSTEAANWHPLTWLSHALDYQLFALNPAGHHLDSVLIHALDAALLFLLLAWITKRVGPSLLVAALFAVHPINVESVAWVSERKNVLSTLFFLLAIGAYAWYAQKPGWRRYLLVAALFTAGLMAKPMVITLPFLLLLLDYWPLERTPLTRTQSSPAISTRIPPVTFLRLLLEKIPLLLLSAASAWITLKSQRTVVHTFEEIALATRIQNAVVAYGLYLWKMLWPAHLAFYPYSVNALPAWQWILSAFVLISVTAFVLIFRRKGYLPVGWFWFLGTLVPVIGLVQVGEASMADRYGYVPLIGIFIMIAWSLADFAEAKKVRAVWLAIPASCALVALACVSYHQMNYWESDYDLWSHTLEISENPFTHNALGVVLMNPGSKMSQHDLENFGTGQKRIDEARRHFERALELRGPLTQQDSEVHARDTARTLNNLGNLDRLQGRTGEARQNTEGALNIYRRLAQQNPDAYLPYLSATLDNLGSMDRLQNRMDEARQHYEEALAINRQLADRNPSKYLPNMAMTLNDLGFLDAMQSRIEDARQHYEEALKIDRQLVKESPAVYLPDLAMTLSNFGFLDASQNRMGEARQHFQEALGIQRQLAEQNPAVYLPDMAMTLKDLGRVNRLQNRIEESRANYQEALSLFQNLSQGDNRYAGEVARVEASLQELDKKAAPHSP